jgi:16S rRNA (cytosine967-C5)-methyltransferase
MTVERGPSHSDDLLHGKAVDALPAPDRNLATALVLGVLRWQIRLDHQLQVLLKRPNAKLDPEVRIALRLGAFQLLHMDRIPARAAIDESVELAKQAGHRFASGMVNAVLRKLAATRFDFSEGNAAELALAQAHPAWMVERWAVFYGLEAARAICRYGQAQPTMTVRIESPAIEAELAQAGVVLEAGELLSAARRVVSGDVTATTACLEGRVRLQDEGSQLVAELASACFKDDSSGSGSSTTGAKAPFSRPSSARLKSCPDTKRDDETYSCDNSNQKEGKILDSCAAPGGKTLILAECNPQARIVACESSAPRLEQLRKRLAHLGNRVECRLADAAALTEESAFDLALADVPCSGTGTLRRNPEIRHRLHPEDLPRQAKRQRVILHAALRAVRPGGRVVYSTCSLEPEENEQVVAAVLKETQNAHLISLDSRIEALLREGILTTAGAGRLHHCLTPEGALRLLPGAFRTDGFFIARIERIA